MKKYSLFVGIDISKLKIDVAIHGSSQHKVFENNPSGFKAMAGWINSIASLKECFFCMEHTGIYAIPLCYYLNGHQYSYTLVPALAIKKSLGIQRGKNDKADARAIAKFISIYHHEVKIYQLPEDILMKLKLMLSHRDRLIKAKNLFSVPVNELKSYIKQGMADEVIAQSREELKLLKKQIRDIDMAMLALVKSDERLAKIYQLIISVPGIGPQISLNMLVVTRCFTSFDNSRSFACYCGIAPFAHTSGTSIKKPDQVSDLANKKIKSILSMGATSVVGHDHETRRYYQRKLKEGKAAGSILNAIKNKMMHRVFAVVKRETPFVKLDRYAA